MATGRRIRRLTGAQGAAESGLAKLVELGVLNAMGDAIITIALANTLFFAVPSGQARGRVALYLVVTMVPFVLVAPVIGPFLDRFRTGRRWAMGLALFVRGFLCWVMADAIDHGGWQLYPAAFGCLTASKAYIVTRASTVPRLLPERLTLVSANSRISLAGSAGTAAAGVLGGSLAYLGSPAWPLRVGFAVFMAATVLCILLPARADSAEGEQDLEVLPTPGSRRSRPKLRSVAPQVELALRANAGLRAAAGVLLIFGAFLLREHPFAGVPAIASAALVGGAAAVGALAGTSLGTVVGSRRPQGVVRVAPVIVGLAALVAAVWYTPLTFAVVGFCAGFAQQSGKLSLDALIQRDVPDANRSSVFAVSETIVQLSWVVGGAIAILLPLRPRIGLAVIVALVVLTLVSVATGRRGPAGGAVGGRPGGGPTVLRTPAAVFPPDPGTAAGATTAWPPAPTGGWLSPPATCAEDAGFSASGRAGPAARSWPRT